MLSILIPTYNYNTFSLVEELTNQAIATGISFEIIVLDDGSTDQISLKENSKINTLENCSYKILEKNIGRSAIRNLLAKTAKFENLLFLDSDTIPTYGNFISEYIAHINDDEKIIYGGILYQKEKPNKTKILRWVYGNKREALLVEQRNKNCYLSFLTLNFLIKKSVFNKVIFNESIPNLRHEDTLFSFELKQKNIPVFHINNPVYHLGLESSIDFLKKSEESIIGLHYLISHRLILPEYTKLSKTYFYLEKMKLIGIFRFMFNKSQFLLKKNLLSENPSLFVYDLYRIGYYCKSVQKQ
ncbi:Glycosyltransferase, GT2 family [Flavobacterium swingsii]|jgi:glycosyltransferase involved in cell wall biosynthesis|uniref:Glycosyltransferase, GT2 family n=1 Tax=Flavobacterium swingsii TaxID=498292 RepID=A0A1I0WJ47_9FLAO|nr:glycosyltransferase [Flavobacterium swingsii]SFA88772.1 Glycosyltransferase, GT2 family [Flavobacterium swingsii]